MTDEAPYTLDDLLYLMSCLRDPDNGCPWDVKQSYKSITPSTIEEVYEVVDAIQREDYPHLKEELGDFIFQAVFYAQLAKEDGHFDFHDIIDTLVRKLLRRHPHVFPVGSLESFAMETNAEDSLEDGEEAEDYEDTFDDAPRLSDEEVKNNWEAIKQAEREERGETGLFDDVPRSLPASLRAAKLQKRASKVGFDWADAHEVLEKLEEELEELKETFDEGDLHAQQDELGDLLFSCVNLARHMGTDVESLLRGANGKFERRFRAMEKMKEGGLAGGQRYPLEELDALWDAAKELVDDTGWDESHS